MLFKYLSTALLVSFTLAVQSPVSRNDLVDGKCADIIVIFARGTIELANIGEAIGPSLTWALSLNKKTSGRYIFQGVDYPASITGYFAGGDKNGSKKMADLVKQAKKQCPGKKVVMSGYE